MNTHQPIRRPFPLPHDLAEPRDIDAARPLFRLATVLAVAAARGLPHNQTEQLAGELFPHDRSMPLVVKAAANPATLGTPAWAGMFGGTGVAALLTALAPRSAAAQLFEAALGVDLGGRSQVNVPRVTTGLAPVFVVEGEPAPVAMGTLAVSPVGPPKKMISITSFTNELAAISATSAEATIRMAMIEAAATALDAAVFSTTAASSARPAGLLAGVTPIVATAGGGRDALLSDLKQLAAALAAAGGGRNIWLFAAVPQAVVLQAEVGPAFRVPIVPVPSLAAGTIVAIEVGGIASAYSGTPEVSASEDAVLHFEDTAPAQISTPGTPNVVSAPDRSLWQTNTTALRLILRCAWGTVQPGSVQVIN
jgi:hypothetical protein